MVRWWKESLRLCLHRHLFIVYMIGPFGVKLELAFVRDRLDECSHRDQFTLRDHGLDGLNNREIRDQSTCDVNRLASFGEVL